MSIEVLIKYGDLSNNLYIDSVTSEQNRLGGTLSSDTNVAGNMESTRNYEECWAYNCLTLHMPRLRKIYNDYATLYAKSASICNVSMSRLCLWQLWRDCGIHKKGLSLNDIDNYIGEYFVIIHSILTNVNHKMFTPYDIINFLQHF